MKIIYHIFTNNRDEWLSNYDRAVELFNDWSKEFGCARLYEEKWNNPKTNDQAQEEDCIKSYGYYPF